MILALSPKFEKCQQCPKVIMNMALPEFEGLYLEIRSKSFFAYLLEVSLYTSGNVCAQGDNVYVSSNSWQV